MTSGTGESDTSPRLLGLFAHPDDEVFCAGGVFAQAGRQGADTRVVSFTKGEAGQIRHADIATRSTLGSVRATELSDACVELGVTEALCLDFPDGSLVDLDRSELLSAAVIQIRSFRPDRVYSFDETGAYGHPDHVVMAEVAAAACDLAADPTFLPEAGPAFTCDQLLQARFPQSERLLLKILVDWLANLDERFHGTDEFTTALMMFADGTTMLGYASDHLSVEWFPAGSYIIEQGAPPSGLYMVLSGSVEVVVEDSAGTMSAVATVGSGEFIGEVGLAEGQRRNAHCIAAENTACFVFTAAARSAHAAHDAVPTPDAASRPQELPINSEVDVSAFVSQKVAALAKHQSQYAIVPGLFPDAMLDQLLGTEYFYCARSAQTADPN